MEVILREGKMCRKIHAIIFALISVCIIVHAFSQQEKNATIYFVQHRFCIHQNKEPDERYVWRKNCKAAVNKLISYYNDNHLRKRIGDDIMQITYILNKRKNWEKYLNAFWRKQYGKLSGCLFIL